MNAPTRPTAPKLSRRLTDYQNPRSLGSRFRARRMAPLRRLIEDAHARRGEVRILDVGGRKIYWSAIPRDFLLAHRVHLTIFNLPQELLGEDDELFRHVAGDACDMAEYTDGAFDVVHSNSVIEHVGDWSQAKRFAREVRRVGRGLFVQTPNFWFPVEPHYVLPFFHWLPRPLQVNLMRRRALGNLPRLTDLDAAIQAIDAVPRLLDRASMQLLFPDCRIVPEKLGFLTKSWIALRAVDAPVENPAATFEKA